MRRLAPLFALLVAALAPGARPAAAEEAAAPAPRFDRVDHARPDAHLAISPHVGDAQRIRSLADQLKRDTPRGTLAAISQWLHRNLRFNKAQDQTWRTFDEMIKERSYSGCADHAMVFGTLARACGIPTIWVKTMDVAWIQEFREGRPGYREYRGHVFLEVHLEGSWQLLDATSMELHSRYDPTRTRILPGHRFAYDKGDDPYELVLSCRWELWLAQTRRHFSSMDLGLLPWGAPHDLLASWRVFIAGNSPFYGYAQTTCERLGYDVVTTFNRDYDLILPRTRGRTLIVTCQGHQPVLPEALWADWLPPGHREVAAGRLQPPEAYLDHRLADGTHVILVTAQDYTEMQRALAKALAREHR